jgi:hypothetical protein
MIHALLLFGCVSLERDAQPFYAKVVYDLAEGDIPLPNDAARDIEAGHLDLPTDGMEKAEVDFRQWLNGRDAWSSTFPVHFELNFPVDPETLDASTVQVLEWGVEPSLVNWHWESEVTSDVDSISLAVDDDGYGITIQAPRAGWRRGGDYVVAVVGGEHGLLTQDGLPVGPDAGFTYLRQQEPLDTVDNQRAFPGDSRAERMAAGARLEAIRQTLTPAFDLLEGRGVIRDDIAALWRFSVTADVELAMDKSSQRMPVPFDLLVDPDTQRVDLAKAAWDDELEADAKLVANRLNGFGVSPNLQFEFTGPVDPDTLTVRVFDVSQTPVEVPSDSWVMSSEGACTAADEGCIYGIVAISADAIPLHPATTYVVVVDNGLVDAEGLPVQAMPIGQLLLGKEPLTAGGASQVGSLDDDGASRLEGVRIKMDALLDDIGRDGVLAAWPFTTLDPVPALTRAAHRAEDLGLVSAPDIYDRLPAYDLLFHDALNELFPGVLNPAPVLYLGRVDGVKEIVQGTLQMPYFLDAETRRWREDGQYEMHDVEFWAVVPEKLDPEKPVVIFGHAVVTDRRFITMVSGELAQRGFASVAIDFPFHGERVACVDASLVAVPNFLPEPLQSLTGLTDNLLWLPPCASGIDASCSAEGECLDPYGRPEEFSSFPIIDLQPASGAAFLDVDDMPHIPDHFAQALSDLGALRASLQQTDWSPVFGQATPTDRVNYLGMSLGSIIGMTWVAVSPEVDRAVFNVPGGSLVELFQDSAYFSPQINAYLDDLEAPPGSYDEERLLNIARWLVDSVDPHSVAHLYEQDGRTALIQMDQVTEGLGDMVIPNRTTERLQRVSGLPMLTYPSILHGDLVIPIVGDGILEDAVDFLETGEAP